VLSLTQSKRGSSVVLPTSDGLRKVLQQQQDDFGWQQYIAPSRHRDGKQGLMPMSLDTLHQTGGRIMKAAGLPDELRMADLRRTAITEMVEVGVPLPSIMAVSGHATPMSLTPYIRNTLRGSTTAQNMRQLPETML
jgi:integrase